MRALRSSAVTWRCGARRILAIGAIGVGSVLAAAVFAAAGSAGSTAIQVTRSTDTGLCHFKLVTTVSRRVTTSKIGKTTYQVFGPATVTLRNAATGRTKVLASPGSYSVDQTTGSVRFHGLLVWFGVGGSHAPYLSTDYTGNELAPDFTLSHGIRNAHVIDPCALLSATPPSTTPVTTPAPWGLPASALSQIAYAGLVPVLGNLVRHDHVHLDLIVNGQKVTIPAGVGAAEPVPGGVGACPPGSLPNGDCATHHFFTAKVALAPIHTHSTSGIIHIEADEPGTFTLGQFFDVWGVRLDSTCIGSYCAGHGKTLRAYVNGKRVPGNPRSIVLTNHQEIAVVFGAPGEARVPSTYTGGWPGLGCGGVDEHSCFP
jgi:hypothetical protein